MGISTRITGYQKADETWIKKKQIWDWCNETDTTVPEEILKFFEGEYPGNKPGMETRLPDDTFTKFSEYMTEGYQIEVDKIPDGIQFIQVSNNY